jgi:hypothetical protein
MGMRRLVVPLAVALALSGCGSEEGQDVITCRAPVSGGTAAQRTLVNGVLCATGNVGLRVRIAPAPAGLPKGTSELLIDAKAPALPASPTGRRAAEAQAVRESMWWFAAVVAGAVRDKSEQQQPHLPRIVLYELRYDTPGKAPELQTQGRIALPGWGDPEGQGSAPPATLGHGAPAIDALEKAVHKLGVETDSEVRIGGGTPLGMAPAIFIRARHPYQLLSGPIKRFLEAAKFSENRYDGVLIEVDDQHHTPVWIAQTASRIGETGCATLGGMPRPVAPSRPTPAERACAFAGVGLG